jgi:hypothetical protein
MNYYYSLDRHQHAADRHRGRSNLYVVVIQQPTEGSAAVSRGQGRAQ